MREREEGEEKQDIHPFYKALSPSISRYFLLKT